MSKIIDNLYIGDVDNASDAEWLSKNGIQNILSIMDSQRIEGRSIESSGQLQYLRLTLFDIPSSQISLYFPAAIQFIHECRLANKPVLIHCLMGRSRSVTLATAYLIAITDLPPKECLRAIKTARVIASPNKGFKNQLEAFYRKRDKNMYQAYRDYENRKADVSAVRRLIDGRKKK